MSHMHKMAKAYQEQLLEDAEFDQGREDVKARQRKPAMAFIRSFLNGLKRTPQPSQRRRDAADLDAKPV